MKTLGYIASIFIGITLGLIGGGGSILTVPVLVYLFAMDAISATAHSLFIVGLTSLSGSLSYFKNGLVNIKTAVIFGIPSLISVLITRAYIVPAIPREIFNIGGFLITKSIFLMLLFALLMIAASYGMIRKGKKEIEADSQYQFNYSIILMQGALVGVVTGLIGAGGGFLIIPALVLLTKLPIKESIGTSLIIIAVNSFIGFLGTGSETIINWQLLLTVSAFAVSGIFIGTLLSQKIDGEKLKPGFGWFVLLMGVYIILRETFFQ